MAFSTLLRRVKTWAGWYSIIERKYGSATDGTGQKERRAQVFVTFCPAPSVALPYFL